MLRVIRRDERGATAIEYGLIAGLIALGMVGALVGTRSSLSTSLTQDAQAMSSATAVKPLVPNNPRWSTKTLASKSTGTDASGAPVTVFNYTDGTHVRYQAQFTKANGVIIPETIKYTAESSLSEAQTMQSGYTDANGNVVDPIYTQIKYNYPSTTYSQTNANRISSDGNVYGTITNYDSSGQVTRVQTGTGVGYAPFYQPNIDDATYFNRLVASQS